MRGLQRLCQRALGAREVACQHQRAPEDRQELPPFIVRIRKEGSRAGKKADRGGGAPARTALPPGSGQSLAGRRGELRVGGPQFLPVPERLLDVVAHELIQLAGRAEPVRVCEMQLGAGLLGEPDVRGIADQHMAEPVAVVALDERAVGLDQVATYERKERGTDGLIARKCRHRASGELSSDYGRAFEHYPL